MSKSFAEFLGAGKSRENTWRAGMFLGALNESRFPPERGPGSRPLSLSPISCSGPGRAKGELEGRGVLCPPPRLQVLDVRGAAAPCRWSAASQGQGRRPQVAVLVDLSAHCRMGGWGGSTGLLCSRLGDSEPSLEGGAWPAGCPGRAAPRDDRRDSLALVGVLARLASNPIFTQRGLSCSRSSPLASPRTDALEERAVGSRSGRGAGDSVSLGQRPTALELVTPMTFAGVSEQMSWQQIWKVLHLSTPKRQQRESVPGWEPWPCLQQRAYVPEEEDLMALLDLKG